MLVNSPSDEDSCAHNDQNESVRTRSEMRSFVHPVVLLATACPSVPHPAGDSTGTVRICMVGVQAAPPSSNAHQTNRELIVFSKLPTTGVISADADCGCGLRMRMRIAVADADCGCGLPLRMRIAVADADYGY